MTARLQDFGETVTYTLPPADVPNGLYGLCPECTAKAKAKAKLAKLARCRELQQCSECGRPKP